VTPGCYTSVYVGPVCYPRFYSDLILFQISYSSAHPRLNLRLTSPAEPGFFLQRAQVKSTKETWRVLEVRSLAHSLNTISECLDPDRKATMLVERDSLRSHLDSRKLRLFFAEGAGGSQ